MRLVPCSGSRSLKKSAFRLSKLLVSGLVVTMILYDNKGDYVLCNYKPGEVKRSEHNLGR